MLTHTHVAGNIQTRCTNSTVVHTSGVGTGEAPQESCESVLMGERSPGRQAGSRLLCASVRVDHYLRLGRRQ